MVQNILLLLNSEPVRLVPFLCIKIKYNLLNAVQASEAANI